MLVCGGRLSPAILEIGCGEGVFYQSLRQCQAGPYLGVDVSRIAIDLAHTRFGDEVASGAAR